MKKIIALLFAAIMVSACSKDDDSNSTPNTTDDKKEFAVTLNIQNPKLAILETPLKSVDQNGNIGFIRLAFYKVTGEIYLNKTYSIEDLTDENDSIQISLTLPANTYHVAVLGGTATNTSDLMYYINPQNYFSDYYYGSIESNEGVYYNTIDLTVKPSTEPQSTSLITLNPMWSIVNVTVEDAQTFDVPDGTVALEVVVDPDFNGFGIQNQIATVATESELPNNLKNVTSLDLIRKYSYYKWTKAISKTTDSNNKLAIKINYLKLEADNSYSVVGTRELKIQETLIENGYYYNVSGKVGTLSSSDQPVSISLGTFNPTEIEIEF